MFLPHRFCPSNRSFSLAVFAVIVGASLAAAAPVTYTLNDWTHVSGRTYKITTPFGNIVATNADYSKYDGEGYVIWQNGNAYTLADINGDKKFLNSFGSTYFTVTFPFEVYSVQFDYQIFPDSSTPSSPSSSTWPDFKFYADGELQFRTLAEIPPAGSRSDNNLNETEPQFIGNSGLWVFPNGVTTLDFVDWPPTIGVANLSYTMQQNDPVVPEPPTWLVASLLIISLGAFGYLRKRPNPIATQGTAV